MTTRGVKFYAMLPPEGYGEAARRAILGLHRAGIPVTVTPLAPEFATRGALVAAPRAAVSDQALASLCYREIPYDTVVIHAPPDNFPRFAAAEKGRRILGQTVWETDTLPPRWQPWLDAVHGVIVPCTWNRDVLRAAGSAAPVFVVPHIATERPAIGDAAVCPAARPFTVLAIGMWSSRKNLAGAVAAYFRAFRGRRDVRLVLKTSARDLTHEVLGSYPLPVAAAIATLRIRHGAVAPVEVVTANLDAAGIAALHARAHAYLSVSRGEGWGLGAFDAAASGCPVVTPLHGGPRDWLGDAHPFAVGWRSTGIAPRGYEIPLFAGAGNWIEPDIAHAAAQLRRIREAPREAFAAAAVAATRIAKDFHWRVATDALLAAFAATPQR